jgi:hypothetical protein
MKQQYDERDSQDVIEAFPAPLWMKSAFVSVEAWRCRNVDTKLPHEKADASDG